VYQSLSKTSLHAAGVSPFLFFITLRGVHIFPADSLNMWDLSPLEVTYCLTDLMEAMGNHSRKSCRFKFVCHVV
jgi:hypothetical protein